MTWQIALLLISPLTLVFAMLRKVDRIEDKLDDLVVLLKIDLEFRALTTGNTEMLLALRNRTGAANRYNHVPTRS